MSEESKADGLVLAIVSAFANDGIGTGEVVESVARLIGEPEGDVRRTVRILITRGRIRVGDGLRLYPVPAVAFAPSEDEARFWKGDGWSGRR
jgi:hypothetical protein